MHVVMQGSTPWLEAPKGIRVMNWLSFVVWCACGLFGPLWLVCLAAFIDATVAARWRKSIMPVPVPPPDPENQLQCAQFVAVHFFMLWQWQTRVHSATLLRLAGYLVVMLGGVMLRHAK